MTERLPWARNPAVEDGTPAQPAATVVLLRDGPAGVEVLMLRRTSAVAFGGTWVFPGGRVEAADADPAAPADEVAAARRAAVREAAEEAGVTVAPDTLVPTALWDPPPQAPRRYRTWFFVAAGAPVEVAVDGSEIEAHEWLPPGEALARHAAGQIELVPPTWVTLWQVAADAAAPTAGGEAGASGAAGEVPEPGPAARVVAAAQARAPAHFATRMAVDGHRVAALWQGDAGYDRAELDAPGPRRRLWLAPGPWRPEWSAARPGDAGGLWSGPPES